MAQLVSNLEVALARQLKSQNPLTPEFFDNLAKVHLGQENSIRSVKAYLKGEFSSPCLMALMVYSMKGRYLLRTWLSQGLVAKDLYHAMLHDGTTFAKSGLDFPLTKDIITGGHEWDFDLTQLRTHSPFMGSLPGLAEAVAARFREKGMMNEFLKSMPYRGLINLIREKPMSLAPEISQLTYRDEYTREDREEYIAVDLYKRHLDAETAIDLVTGSGF